jgi:hypothetical protein
MYFAAVKHEPHFNVALSISEPGRKVLACPAGKRKGILPTAASAYPHTRACVEQAQLRREDSGRITGNTPQTVLHAKKLDQHGGSRQSLPLPNRRGAYFHPRLQTLVTFEGICVVPCTDMRVERDAPRWYISNAVFIYTRHGKEGER